MCEPMKYTLAELIDDYESMLRDSCYVTKEDRDEIGMARAELTNLIRDRDTLRLEVEELRGALEDVQYVADHGCLSGDCPHRESHECFTSVTKHLMETAAAARAALKRQGGAT